jgi:hypothetical protein
MELLGIRSAEVIEPHCSIRNTPNRAKRDRHSVATSSSVAASTAPLPLLSAGVMAQPRFPIGRPRFVDANSTVAHSPHQPRHLHASLPLAGWIQGDNLTPCGSRRWVFLDGHASCGQTRRDLSSIDRYLHPASSLQGLHKACNPVAGKVMATNALPHSPPYCAIYPSLFVPM